MAKARFGSAVMTSTGWEADKSRVSAHRATHDVAIMNDGDHRDEVARLEAQIAERVGDLIRSERD
jgi:hypothetical protein